MGWRDRGVEIKTPEQLLAMRRAGLVVADALEALRDAVRPGVTTAELNAVAEDRIRNAGAVPSFLGYQEFPASICTSVDEQVVHGIPGDRVLAEGDLVSLDCGAIVEGWHGDAAITVPVGTVGAEALDLIRVTEESMWRGIAAARVGGRLGDISNAVGEHVRDQRHDGGGYGIVETYVGHGIGSAMHQAPNVPNQGRRGRGIRLVEGLALAVEPMVTLGSAETVVLDDEWTVVTSDGSWSAHCEHTFALTATGVWVLTAADGGEEMLTALGAPFGPVAS